MHRRLALLLVLVAVVAMGACGDRARDEANDPALAAAATRAERLPYGAWRDYAIESEARRLGLSVSEEEIEAYVSQVDLSQADDEGARSLSDAEARAGLRTVLLLEKIARHPKHFGESLAEDLHARMVQMMTLTQALLARTWPVASRPISAEATSRTLKVQENELLLVVAGQGAAVIEFVDFGRPDEAVEYRWRYQPVADVPEAVGSGWVREKYETVDRDAEEDGGAHHLTDLGGQLFVYAGPIVVEWSRNTTNAEWVYYDSEVMTARVLPDSDFDDLDLRAPPAKRDR